MSEKKPPVLLTPIPLHIMHEGASFTTLDLNNYIESPDVLDGIVRFSVELLDGRPLPKGLICLEEGNVIGIPGKNTAGNYEFVVIAKNDSDQTLTTQFSVTIKEPLALDEVTKHFTDLKAKIWDALGHDLPLPEIDEFLNRPVTASDVYYLLDRFGRLIIWDVYNLDSPGELNELHLEGMSEHYHVYDRGSCLVATPKDLYAHERTKEDAMMTARAMAREVFKRDWTVELAGLDKMVRACWVELQVLMQHHDKIIEIIQYNPSPRDLMLMQVKSAVETEPSKGL